MHINRNIIVIALAALILPSSLRAATEVVDGITWTYTILGGKALVGSESSSSTAVPTSPIGVITIPSALGGYPVTGIGNSAFYGCSGLISVTIPDSVTSIGKCAFRDCCRLKKMGMSSPAGRQARPTPRRASSHTRTRPR